jgi:hypothetical protein
MIKDKTKKSTALVPARAARGGQEKLPSALRPVLDGMAKSFAKIDSLTQKTSREVVLAWYEVGLRVAEVERDESKYGEHAVIRLAEELSARRGRTVRPDDLYQAKVVTNIYRRNDIEKLFARAEKANVQISWGHFSRGLSLLSKPEDTALRKRYEAQLIAEGMNVEDFCGLIRDDRKKSGAPRSGARRRPSCIPKNAGAACRQIRCFGSHFADQLDAWDRSLFDWVIRNATPDELTDELLDELRETQTDVSKLGKMYEEVGGKLEEAIERVEKVLARREELKEEVGGKPRKGVHEEENVDVEVDEVEPDEVDEGDEDEGDEDEGDEDEGDEDEGDEDEGDEDEGDEDEGDEDEGDEDEGDEDEGDEDEGDEGKKAEELTVKEKIARARTKAGI